MPRARPPLQPATSGAGPLLQRDYWAVIRRCHMRPSEVIAFVAERFVELPPKMTVTFRRAGDQTVPLSVGAELDIRIRLSGQCRVRVVHQDACSFTLATLRGHPEAGRITFGAYRNAVGHVVFHIRSRARSCSLVQYAALFTGGDPMQTTTWTDFVDAVAASCGDGVIGSVRASTRRLPKEALDEDDASMDRPTFLARGD